MKNKTFRRLLVSSLVGTMIFSTASLTAIAKPGYPSYPGYPYPGYPVIPAIPVPEVTKHTPLIISILVSI